MAPTGSGNNNNILWTFNTIHIAYVSVTYIDRHFAVAFEDELVEEWELVDSKSQIHFVTYNLDVECPRITHGWMDIRRDYHISGDRHVQFRYTGNNHFEITVFPGTCTEFSMQRSKHINQVVLSGPKSVVVCKLLISDSPRSTKIGKGWKEFCSEHQLKEGDRVLFEVDHADADEFIIVFVNKFLCDE
ncbi:hypothetical protein DEO72_LG5g2155 [Vigna unguiculata]|uniref:TF-B3 domain-containing protein n=1 Tax=Vigna unguiculata TaxID=3917 RepID=A0A4D6LZJ2_VIGUN|nr:hypothetical protein DEO72_LG5g2155 [Vigna unguiculata]